LATANVISAHEWIQHLGVRIAVLLWSPGVKP